MKQSKPQVVTESLDPATERYRDDIFNRGREVSNTPYTANPNGQVSGANPLTQEGVNHMRSAGDQLQRYADQTTGQAERANQLGQHAGNLGMGFGQQAGSLRDGASRFDEYGREMMASANQGDARGAQMDQWGQQFNNYAQSGDVGARALGGDQAATDQLMNPYQSQVMDAVGADFDKQRAAAHTQSNQAATQAGAFGGDRHGVMEGARLGELDSAQMATQAQLRQTGFNDAMGRAGQAANLGLGAGQMDLQGRQVGQGDRQIANQTRGVGQQFNQLGIQGRQLGQGYDGMNLDAQGLALNAQNSATNAYGQAGQLAQGQAGIGQGLMGAGDYYRQIQEQQRGLDDQRFNEQRDWGARNFDILKGGMSGMPYGGQTSQPMQHNAASGILGGAATGFGIGGPIGAGIGGILGMFG